MVNLKKLSVVTIILVILLFTIVTAVTPPLNNSNLINNKNYQGVILTSEGAWVPDHLTIDNFENGLKSYLQSLVSNSSIDSKTGTNYNIADLNFIINNLKNYKRQYIGMTINSKQMLYVNFITVSKDGSLDWQKQRIEVFDGGSYFFQIYFDNDNNKYFDLNINGIA